MWSTWLLLVAVAGAVYITLAVVEQVVYLLVFRV
jgi:hypothetical protein